MKNIWACKIGEVDPEKVPHGADGPMRDAVVKAYFELTGEECEFIFSGWGARLTEPERAVVESRLPSTAHAEAWHAGYEAALEAVREAGSDGRLGSDAG